MRHLNTLSHVSVPFRLLTFESLRLETSFLVFQLQIQNVKVMFVYQGHWVKVKVTKFVYCVRGWSAFDWKAILFVIIFDRYLTFFLELSLINVLTR